MRENADQNYFEYGQLLSSVAFLHLEKSGGGFQYILLLLLTDHFTRYTQAYPTKYKAARTATNHLYNDFILRFGIPFKILHDRGGEFKNELFKDIANGWYSPNIIVCKRIIRAQVLSLLFASIFMALKPRIGCCKTSWITKKGICNRCDYSFP